MMPAYFTRLGFAFRTFFSILDHGRIPDDVSSALGVRVASAPEPPAPESRVEPPPVAEAATAAQMLAVLQRDGRLIDFLMEDLGSYADAQIGVAARNVHTGCRQALQRYLTLGPVLDHQEGDGVTVDAGTSAGLVKVIGNVAGKPPFRGVLRHRGWRLTRIELPAVPTPDASVVAPAEVEVP